MIHVDQPFRNEKDASAEAVYIFPLLENAMIAELVYWFNLFINPLFLAVVYGVRNSAFVSL